MAEYQYIPDLKETNSEEEMKQIESLEPAVDNSASTSLADLDAFENSKIKETISVPYSEYSEKVVDTITKPVSVKYKPSDNPRLKQLSNSVNLKNIKPVPDLGKSFFSNLATVYMEIIDDLAEVNSVEDLYLLISKEENLVAIGILLVFLSVFLLFFNKLN